VGVVVHCFPGISALLSLSAFNVIVSGMRMIEHCLRTDRVGRLTTAVSALQGRAAHWCVEDSVIGGVTGCGCEGVRATCAVPGRSRVIACHWVRGVELAWLAFLVVETCW
jgi:hypothetical protein